MANFEVVVAAAGTLLAISWGKRILEKIKVSVFKSVVDWIILIAGVIFLLAFFYLTCRKTPSFM